MTSIMERHPLFPYRTKQRALFTKLQKDCLWTMHVKCWQLFDLCPQREVSLPSGIPLRCHERTTHIVWGTKHGRVPHATTHAQMLARRASEPPCSFPRSDSAKAKHDPRMRQSCVLLSTVQVHASEVLSVLVRLGAFYGLFALLERASLATSPAGGAASAAVSAAISTAVSAAFSAAVSAAFRSLRPSLAPLSA